MLPAIPNILLKPEPYEIAYRIFQVFYQLFPPQGMYEVLDYNARLELRDPQGKNAVYYKRQKVRFLQDNVIAYQDQAWGDGELFADYKCSPGKPVDRYQEGNRWRILISLRETKQRGDVEEFHIERHIKNGFTEAQPYFGNRVDHRIEKMSVSVVFPKGCAPRQLVLMEHNANRTTQLGAAHIQNLPDGRQQVTWQTTHPRLYELYSIRWRW